MTSKIMARWLAVALAMLTVGTGHTMADGTVIDGKVIYRERVMLPDSAVVRVKLLDVSRADAPATVLGETVATGKSPPYFYSISYDPDAILSGHRYVVSAQITDGGQLLFTSTTSNEVFGDGPGATDIVVQRVADAPSASVDATGPAGHWLAEDIDGGGVIDNLQTVLDLAADGTISGSGGCNRIGGRAEIAGDAITFGKMISTMMACAPAAMDQEEKFLKALDAVTHYRLDGERDKLVLLDAEDKPVLVLARHTA